MKKAVQLFLCVFITLSVGAVSGIATADEVTVWYASINKPSFNPPDYVFGPVWSVLYLLMGVSLYLIIRSPSNKFKRTALIAFSIQLTLNFLWSLLFFKFHMIGVALVEIIMIWLAIAFMITSFMKIHKTAAYLQIPYLLWVTFATVLNFALWYLN